MIIGYNYNATIIIVQEGNPKGTWIFGAIGRELRWLNLTKLVSLAPKIL
jgi:large subunit ribosomal protein L14